MKRRKVENPRPSAASARAAARQNVLNVLNSVNVPMPTVPSPNKPTSTKNNRVMPNKDDNKLTLFVPKRAPNHNVDPALYEQYYNKISEMENSGSSSTTVSKSNYGATSSSSHPSAAFNSDSGMNARDTSRLTKDTFRPATSSGMNARDTSSSSSSRNPAPKAKVTASKVKGPGAKAQALSGKDKDTAKSKPPSPEKPQKKPKTIKPRSAFVFFCKLMRDDMTRRYQNRNGGQDPSQDTLAKGLSQRYDKLDSTQRAPYEKMEVLDQVRYTLQKMDFVGDLGGELNEEKVNEICEQLDIAASNMDALKIDQDFMEVVKEMNGKICDEVKLAIRRRKLGDQGVWKTFLEAWTYHQARSVRSSGSAGKDTRTVVRDKISDILGDPELGHRIEYEIYERHNCSLTKEYKSQSLMLISNLKNKELFEKVTGGDVQPYDLVRLDAKDLAPSDLRRERELLEEKSLHNTTVTAKIPTSKFDLMKDPDASQSFFEKEKLEKDTAK